MNLNIKKLINGCVFAAAGFFGFIFMALDFVFAHYRGVTASYATGYGFIGINVRGSEVEFLKTLTGILLVIGIIGFIVLLLLGTIKILDAAGIEITFVAPYAALINKITKIFTLVYLCIFGAAYLFTLIWCLANSSYYGFAPGIGAYLLLIFAAAVYVVPLLLDKYMPEQNAAQPRTVFVCTKCGKKCANGAKFCDACGGEVVSKLQYPVVFVQEVEQLVPFDPERLPVPVLDLDAGPCIIVL